MDLVMKGNNAEGKVLEAAPSNVIDGESTKMATHYMLLITGNHPQVTWFSTTETNLLTFDENLADFILSGFTSSEDTPGTIHGCTEYVYNDLFMRCHPSYQGEGPWFDWVSIHFEECTVNGKRFPEDEYPGKVVAIIPKQHNSFLDETVLVVQSAQSQTGTNSVLFKE